MKVVVLYSMQKEDAPAVEFAGQAVKGWPLLHADCAQRHVFPSNALKIEESACPCFIRDIERSGLRFSRNADQAKKLLPYLSIRSTRQTLIQKSRDEFLCLQ